MNSHELIELMMLHSLGMLDEDEAKNFEEAYESSSPSVRQLVRDEAERMTDLGYLLPDEIDESLRDMVVAAVRAAMRETESIRAGTKKLDKKTIEKKIDKSIQIAEPKLSPQVRRYIMMSAMSITMSATGKTVSVKSRGIPQNPTVISVREEHPNRFETGLEYFMSTMDHLRASGVSEDDIARSLVQLANELESELLSKPNDKVIVNSELRGVLPKDSKLATEIMLAICAVVGLGLTLSLHSLKKKTMSATIEQMKKDIELKELSKEELAVKMNKSKAQIEIVVP